MDATPRVARKAQAELTGILERIRGSPVVHAGGPCRWSMPVVHAGGPCRWSMPVVHAGGPPAGVRTDTTATCGPSAPPPSATSCVGAAARPWWMRSWAISSLACWSATSTPPITITTAPSNPVGPTCCRTSTTCAHSTPMMTGMMTGWPNGLTPSTNSTVRRAPSPILQTSNGQSSNGAPPNWPWNSACWPSAVPTRMTHRRPPNQAVPTHGEPHQGTLPLCG